MERTDIIGKINAVNEGIRASLTEKTLSVSKCIGYIKKEFDKEAVAKNTVAKYGNDPNSKYFQKTVEEIINMWEEKASESRQYGSMLDDYIGHRLEGNELDLEEWKLDNNYDYNMRLKGICDGFDQLYDDVMKGTDFRYVTREAEMFIKSANGNIINGRFDCLFYSPSKDKLLLIDWKTNESIETDNKYKQKMLGPCCDMPACNGNEYTVQLHMYKKALFETYGIIDPMKIETFICQMVPTPSQGMKHYSLYKENFPYNSKLLDNIIDYSYKKHEIQKKKAEMDVKSN